MAGDTMSREDGKLWVALRELEMWARGEVQNFRTILTGVDGTNGINGKLKALHADHEDTKKRLAQLDSKIDSARAEALHKWEVERFEPGKCIGSTEVKKLREELARTSEIEASREAEHRKTQRQLYAAIAVALITAGGGVATTVIQSQATRAVAEMQMASRSAPPVVMQATPGK